MAYKKKQGRNRYYSTEDAIEFIDNLEPYALLFYRRALRLREKWGHIDKQRIFTRIEMLILKYHLTKIEI